MNETKSYYLIEPEVPGQWADDIVVDRSTHPPEVKELSIVFDGWLGDDILEVFPSFIVTERLAEAMYESGLSGFEFRDVKISISEQFKDLYGEKELPRFLWLTLHREEARKDVALKEDGSLLLSERAMSVFKRFNLQNCDMEN